MKTRLKWLIAILTIGAVGVWIYKLPPKPVYLPSLIVVVNGWDSGLVSALGTWRSDADKTLYQPSFPVKTSKIECYKRLGYCFESIATFKDNLLLADLDMLEIERWDRESIIIRPQKEGICGELVMSINRAMKSLDALITRRDQSELCDGFPKEQRLRKWAIKRYANLGVCANRAAIADKHEERPGSPGSKFVTSGGVGSRCRAESVG